jgi:hypothetical protein
MSKYKIVESKDLDKFAVQLTEGPFKDVVYNYDKVKIVEDEENDQAVLQFDFIVEQGNYFYEIKDIEKNDEFLQTIGDVLMSVFEEQLKADLTSDEDDDADVVVDDTI